MMNKDEAVQKLSKVARISVAYAEDLYDSIVPKPVIPRYIADVPKPVIPWYIADYLEKVKSEGDFTVVGAVNEAPDGRVRDWLFLERVNTFCQAWVNGYTVEGEPRYTVKIKGVSGDARYLNHEIDGNWYINNRQETHRFRTAHTRKELESNGFAWVFDCEGIEIKEVE